MKKLFFSFMTVFAVLFSVESQAVTVFDSITTAISFTDLISALGVVFASMVGVAIFIMGAKIIMRRLGWSA